MATISTKAPIRLAVFLACLAAFSQHVRSELCTDDVCEYELEFTWRSSMTFYYTADRFPGAGQALPVALNGSDLVLQSTPVAAMMRDPMIGKVVSPDDVITADGKERNIIVVNGQLPGPTIEVMKGAQVVIHVKNRLVNEELSIHWHGQYQRDTPFMDGVHGITQCGIPPGTSFTYRFTANPAGTHWYHSHFKAQMLDGGSGMIIVREEAPTMPEHEMIVSDWFAITSDTFVHIHPFEPQPYRGSGGGIWQPITNMALDQNRCDMSGVTFDTAVINYKGRPGGQYPGQELFPLSRFEVTAGERSRFRMVSASAEFAFEISIDGHKMHIVAMDGHDIKPLEVDAHILAQGETIDFEVDADQAPGIYWMRARTMHKGTIQNPTQFSGMTYEARSVLSYNPALSGDPTTEERQCTAAEPCQVFGCPWALFPEAMHKTCISTAAARYAGELDAEYYGLNDPDVTEHWLNAGMVTGGVINGKRFVLPETPIYGKTVDQIPGTCDKLCAVHDPEKTPCFCTQVLDLPLATTMQIVLYNKNAPAGGTCYHHLMHLHGYAFAILAEGYGRYDEVSGSFIDSTNDILCEDEFCVEDPRWNGTAPALNLVDPPIRDSLYLPAGGYAVIRFKTNNPGYWLFHCHQLLHHHDGMVMVMNVAPGQHPPAPPGFPTCENFEYSAQQYEDALKGKYDTVEKETPDGNGNNSEKEEDVKDLQFNTPVFAGIAVGIALGGVVIGAIIGALLCKRRS